MIRALISQSRGFAVFDDGSSLRFLESPDSHGEVELEEIEVAQKIAGVSDLESIECADLESLNTHLELRAVREKLLLATLVLIDSEHSDRAREISAEALDANDNEASYEWVEGVLLSAPLPPTADLAKATSLCPKLDDSLSRLLEVQPQVRKLKVAWDALPEKAFVGQSRQQALAVAVRNGVFRRLIVRPDSSEGPFLAPMDRIRAELRLEVDNAERRTRKKTKPRALKTSGKRAPEWLWKALPWQIAWRAAQWPVNSSSLAENEASRLIASSLGKPLDRPNISDVELSRLYRNWHATRHQPLTVQMIDALSRYESQSRDLLLLDHRNILRSIETDPLGLWRSRGALDPEVLVIDMMMPSLDESPKNWLAKEFLSRLEFRDAGRVIWLGYSSGEARSAHDHVELFDATELIPKGSSGPGRRRESKSSFDRLYLRFLETYSLAQVLSVHGCIICTDDQERRAATQHAVLVDPQRQRSLFLSGQLAWLITELSGGLRGDLSSGVPPVNSGWRTLQQLARNRTSELQITGHDVRVLQEQMSSAGLSENVVEIRGGEIRLNPDMSVTTPLRK